MTNLCLGFLGESREGLNELLLGCAPLEGLVVVTVASQLLKALVEEVEGVVELLVSTNELLSES